MPSGRRVAYTWIGVAPLALYAAVHAWMHYPAVHSVQAWLDRAGAVTLGSLGHAAVLVLIATHVVFAMLDLLARRRARSDGPAEPDTSLGFESVMLALVVGFIAYHAAWLLHVERPEGAPRAAYDQLWAQLGTPVHLVAHAIGITAVAFHVALGLARALALHVAHVRPCRYVGGAVAFLIWLSFAQLLGRFATGEALVPALVVGAPETPALSPQ